MANFFVYILKSSIDDGLYIGYTSNLEKRLKEHNDGMSRYTKNKGPWTIVYFEKVASKREALKREGFLKAQRHREFYEDLIKGVK